MHGCSTVSTSEDLSLMLFTLLGEFNPVKWFLGSMYAAPLTLDDRWWPLATRKRALGDLRWVSKISRMMPISSLSVTRWIQMSVCLPRQLPALSHVSLIDEHVQRTGWPATTGTNNLQLSQDLAQHRGTYLSGCAKLCHTPYLRPIS